MQEVHLHLEFYKVSIENVAADVKELIVHSLEACDAAYVPYSNFQVGCSILLENGEVIRGFNVENAAYSSCICAERNALTTAESLHPKVPISKMVISHKKQGVLGHDWISPCGDCRQVINEFVSKQRKEFEIFLYGHDDNILWIPKATHLLPFGFDFQQLFVK